MKKINLFILTALMMVGCNCGTDVETEESERLKGFDIIIIDSCEYLKDVEVRLDLGYGLFAHKGNCRFCKERRQKELEDLIIKLKEE